MLVFINNTHTRTPEIMIAKNTIQMNNIVKMTSRYTFCLDFLSFLGLKEVIFLTNQNQNAHVYHSDMHNMCWLRFRYCNF